MDGNGTQLKKRAIDQIPLCENWDVREVLRWAFTTFQTDIEIASAFGAEGVVLIDIASSIFCKPKVFTVDTGFLFDETLALARQIEIRYGIRVEWVQSEITPDDQAKVYRPALWKEDPDLCCEIRKVRPLRKKLSGLRAWVTAIRRDQTPARRSAKKIEWDSNFQLVKINPLVDWTHEMVWEYINQHRLAYNPLHDQSYPSIGCTHCTLPVSAGHDKRSGRWAGFTKIECGLHGRNRPSQVPFRER